AKATGCDGRPAALSAACRPSSSRQKVRLMPDISIADRPEAERRYYQLVEAAGTDTDRLLLAIAYGIREAGMTTDHPHIQAMLAYCSAYDASAPAAGAVRMKTPQPAGSGPTVGVDLH